MSFVKLIGHVYHTKTWVNESEFCNGKTHPSFFSYRRLSMRLGIKKEDCHIGMFDVETCKRAIEVLKE